MHSVFRKSLLTDYKCIFNGLNSSKQQRLCNRDRFSCFFFYSNSTLLIIIVSSHHTLHYNQYPTHSLFPFLLCLFLYTYHLTSQHMTYFIICSSKNQLNGWQALWSVLFITILSLLQEVVAHTRDFICWIVSTAYFTY